MKKLNYMLLCLIVISTLQSFGATNCQANDINIDEYPDSSKVEPIIDETDNKSLTIHGGIQNTLDVSLDDCLKYALGNNPRIQVAMQDVFASDSRLRQTWAAYFPQFSWQTGYSRIRQLQLSDVFRENLIYSYWVLGQISASQMLYDFGVTQNQAKIRRLDNEGYKVILTGTVNDVVYQVKDAYYNLQYAIESKYVAEQTVKSFESFYEQAKAFYKSGTKSKVDVTIAEVNLSNAKLSQIQAEHAIKIATAKLSNTMGLPYLNKYNLKDKLQFFPCDITLEKAIKITENSRPEFKLAEIKVSQARQNLKLVQKSYFPQITVEGQYQIGGKHPTSNYGYNFGWYLNFPTINGMLIKNEIREANSLFNKQQSLAINTKNDIYYEVQQAYYTLDEKKNKIPVACLGLKQAKENYDISNGRYKMGVGDPVELRDAKVDYENAQLTYYKTMYEYNSARANLEKMIGRNLCYQEVELDIKQKCKKNKS